MCSSDLFEDFVGDTREGATQPLGVEDALCTAAISWRVRIVVVVVHRLRFGAWSGPREAWSHRLAGVACEVAHLAASRGWLKGRFLPNGSSDRPLPRRGGRGAP